MAEKPAWLQPMGVGVLIEVDTEDEERLPSGLIKPSITKRNQFVQRGTVRAVGEGKWVLMKLHPLVVKVGDRVLFPRMGTAEVEHDGKKWVIMPEPNIFGIVRD